MPLSQDSIARILSGENRRPAASFLRGTLRCAEPFYSAAMRARNALYDRGLFTSHRVPIPIISVGNITAGGTGKTPIVLWLAQRMLEFGKKPAILLRGYH